MSFLLLLVFKLSNLLLQDLKLMNYLLKILKTVHLLDLLHRLLTLKVIFIDEELCGFTLYSIGGVDDCRLASIV